MSNTRNRIIVDGLIGWMGWRAMGTEGRKSLGEFFVDLAQALEQSQLASMQPTAPPSPAQKQLHGPVYDVIPTSTISDSGATETKIDLSSILQPSPLPQAPMIEDNDGRWRDVIVHPSVVLIVGKRGSGKSALAYRLLEVFRHQLATYVVGAPSGARKLLPEWVGIAPTLRTCLGRQSL